MTARTPDCVRFRVTGARPPAARIGHQAAERARRATLGRARLMYGPRGIPAALSGHDAERATPVTEHRHAFWLPEDADGAGPIDLLTVYAQAMDGTALAAPLAADTWPSIRVASMACRLRLGRQA